MSLPDRRKPIDPENYRWRQSGRLLYALVAPDGATPSDFDPLIGVMDTAALAADAVWSHNLTHDRRNAT